MEGDCFQQNRAISGARNRKHEEIYDDLGASKPNSMPDFGIDKLSDDILVHILSGLNLKEAARTSVLSRRWKYLWMPVIRNLEFDDTGMNIRNFKSWVNTVLKLYKPHLVDSLIIRVSDLQSRSFLRISSSIFHTVNSWIRFALQTGVHRIRLDTMGDYAFPNIEKIISYSHVVNSPFRSLRSLQLVMFDIEDDVVHYFLTSYPQLEELCITDSFATKNLHVVDPPNLKVLKIRRCSLLQTLEVSAVNLVSLTYEGINNVLLLKENPNLRELTLGDGICVSFISEPHKHSNYSVQLEKLRFEFYLRRGRDIAPPNLAKLCSLKRVELLSLSLVGRSLLFFSSFIKGLPQIREFRIEISYVKPIHDSFLGRMMPFPSVSAEEAVKYDHRNLELVEMGGFVGSSSEEKFLVHLFEVASTLKRVVIDTQSEYYIERGAKTTRIESKKRAHHLVSTFHRHIEFILK